LIPEEIRSEKIKVFKSLNKLETEEVDQYFVRGQYGEAQGQYNAYREEDPSLANSNTETFVAGKVLINNYRWAGVPFYVRTGKRMGEKLTKIVVEFKNLPM